MDLKQLHDSGELNAYKLAEHLDVTPMSVYNWINGVHEPKYSTVLKIQEFIGTAPKSRRRRHKQ